MSKKDNASKRAASELFSEENEIRRAKDMPDADAARREKLKREMFGENYAPAASVPVPEVTKRTPPRPRNDTGKVSAIPLTKADAIAGLQGETESADLDGIPTLREREEMMSDTRSDIMGADDGSLLDKYRASLEAKTTVAPHNVTGEYRVSDEDTVRIVKDDATEIFSYDDDRTKKYRSTGDLEAPVREKKKIASAPFVRIAIAALCVIVIVAAVVLAIVYFAKDKKEEPRDVLYAVTAECRNNSRREHAAFENENCQTVRGQ